MSRCWGDLAEATVQQHLYGLQLVGWPHCWSLPPCTGTLGMTPLAMDTRASASSLPPSAVSST